MKIDNVGYLRDDYGYPYLVLKVDGIVVTMSVDDAARRDDGFVCLGERFRDKLPPVIVKADPEDGRSEITLYGYTKDKRVVGLAKIFMDDVNSGKLNELKGYKKIK